MLSLIVTQLSSLFIPSHGTSGQSFDPDDSGMVCVSAEDREKVCESESRIQCIVRYIDDACPKGKYEGTFPASTPVKELIDAVAEKFEEDSSEVTLEYQCSAGLLVFSEKTEGTLGTVGLDTEYGARNSMNLVLGRRANQKRDREYRRLRTNADRRAAVSSVRAGELGPEPPKPPALPSTAAANTSTSSGYVGLVNQAMTCYLNSLLQALFMTPEFRNALYKWQFDPSQGALPQKCIPFQLQKLFLNLQTSSKAAVETTELTKSFGWESGEVWQQHDIQELCRVMFDALETEFKNTEQADLINRLYQGKMIDYVKCLECGTEKAKEDVFLDIPLPVRPFMSTIAYKNIGEALKAFVLPETLNGNNQYFCEACNKKCDAHKGLKFCKFPYLLTMHLKRFDFDYNIMHRIKLNDKVVFPEILDLNGFIQNQIPVNSSPEQTIKCDGSSTTDPPEEGTNHLNEESSEPELKQPPILDEDDEVMDLSNYPNDSQENEKNINKSLNRGPFVYELYSIMIHSGSASGGHYYAYIKDFSRGEWYCFNDQSVTPITREDIIKTYGGGHNRMYYNGAHSSSTNAYMLMYRQIDTNLNCQAMSADEFPPHIKKILDEIAEHEERERALKAKEEEMVKLKITCNHPSTSQKTTKVYIHNEDTLADALTVAIMQLKLDTVFPPEQCRLVSYDAERDHLELSFEGKEKSPIKEILEIAEQANRGLNSRVEFFLETREKDKKFFPYNLGDISMVVYLVDLENCDVVSATHLRTSPCQTVEDFKEFLKEAVPLDSKDVHIALARSKNVTYVCEKEPRNNGPRPLNKAGFFSESKVFIAPVTPEDGDISVNFEKSRFYRCVYDLRNVVVLQLTLPRNLEDQCDFLLIPLLDVNDSTRECNEASMDSGDTGARLNGIEEELVCSGASGTSDQSASEDSSLTDSERTIIGDTEVGASDCQVSSGSDSEQLLSPTATPAEDESPSSLCYTDSHGQSSAKSSQPLYFRAELITKVAGPPTPAGESKVIKVVVDKCMNMEMFKTKLEQYVGVAGKHLKVLQSPDSRNELITFNQSGDNDMLGIGLHRHLEPDEFTAKLYHFDINNSKNMLQTKLIELIICKNKTVGDSKADIVKQMAKKGWKVQIDRLRIRIKEWNSPGKILLDNSLWDDHVQIDTLELCFQILDGPERVTSNTFLSAFARRWRPSSMTLGPLTDIVVDKEEEFLQRLAELSDQVPAENIEFAKGPMHTNVLTVRDLSWTSNQEVLVDWMKISYGQPLVIYHRDNREEPKILTEEEEGEIARIELSNLTTGNSTYISSYSPRKERALKIYTSSNKILELD